MDYANLDDVIALFRPLTEEEQSKAEALIPLVCARLRTEARKVGKELDAMITADEDLAEVAKGVTVDIVARTLMTPTQTAGGFGAMSQMSQSAGGYSVSGTFLNPGGGVFVKKSELAALGIRRQQIGVLEIYDSWNNGSAAD
jgi:hypothetical protein